MLDFGYQSCVSVTHVPVSLYYLMKLMRGIQMSKIKRLKTLDDLLEYNSDDMNVISQHAPNSIYLLVESFCPRKKVNSFKYDQNL